MKYAWFTSAISDLIYGHSKLWQDRLAISKDILFKISKFDREIIEANVEGLNGRSLDSILSVTKNLIDHLKTGKGFGFWPFISRPVKEANFIIKEVTINGRKCDDLISLSNLKKKMVLESHLVLLKSLWQEFVELPKNSNFDIQLSFICSMENLLRAALDYSEKSHKLSENLQKLRITFSAWFSVENFELFQTQLLKTYNIEYSKQIKNRFLTIEQSLKKFLNGNAIHNKILESIQKRDLFVYRELINQLVELQKLNDIAIKKKNYIARISTSVPHLASLLGEWPTEQTIKNFKSFDKAYAWKVCSQWFEEMVNPAKTQQILEAIRQNIKTNRNILKNLAAKKAWLNCLERLTPEESFHLKSWADSIRKIGKGTGKHANRYRAEAQRSMQKCRSAIPSWIMPLHRVAETIKPTADMFDVVIIDEASQSGPEALFLYYIAKKIIVVGDDKQISPDPWLNLDAVEHLRQKIEFDFPILSHIGPEDSFFDTSKILFSGLIRLKEHFRCMPEIIQFSNSLCYSNEPLFPLKQYGTDRLEPLKIVHIADGYAEGEKEKIINPPEAGEIAKKIQKCVQDPRFKGKSMGVITLQGQSQAHLIQKNILALIGHEEVEARNIICGDPYTFQGDERDIIFLSMVAAPRDKNIGILCDAKAERRFNVATSRAKEQMWLFHTVTVNDLSDKCLRYRLISYFQEPSIKQTSIRGITVDDLRVQSRTANRMIQKTPPPFDSWFEIDVFFHIHERGYRVIPQYEVAGRRIDLLVEGIRGRLAVECDGDHVHGLDREEEDLKRQLDLERCGLTFSSRIIYSVFQRNPEECLETLWKELAANNIYPGGAAADREKPNVETHSTPSNDSIFINTNESTPERKLTFDDVDSAAEVELNLNSVCSKSYLINEAIKNEFKFTIKDHKNLQNWNALNKKMTNSYEMVLLSALSSYIYMSSNRHSIPTDLYKKAQSAVKRATELGFDLRKNY